MVTSTTAEYMKMIRVTEKTHERLKAYGKFGDSFEDILNRLMDMAEGKVSKK
jgi:hypothetical protein